MRIRRTNTNITHKGALCVCVLNCYQAHYYVSQRSSIAGKPVSSILPLHKALVSYSQRFWVV